MALAGREQGALRQEDPTPEVVTRAEPHQMAAPTQAIADTPVEQALVAQAEQALVEAQALVAQAEQALVEAQALAERAPAEQVPAEQAPAERVPAEQVPAEQVLVVQAQAVQAEAACAFSASRHSVVASSDSEEDSTMHIKIDINFELPRWAKRLVVYVGIPSAMLLGVSTMVYADTVTIPNTFNDGDVLSAQAMNANFEALRNAMNDPDPACPRGYTKDATVTTYVVCKKGDDEVVKVGRGASAFWADRYEASLWQNPDGTGTQYGDASYNIPNTFNNAGFVASPAALIYALSKRNVSPSTFQTWFQANLACRASGKRLPYADEWLAAGTGTPDPGNSAGAGGTCITNANGKRATGGGTQCISAWGAEDMIGNVWELTSEWFASPDFGTVGHWGWDDDITIGVGTQNNLPAVARRGGGNAGGVDNGYLEFDIRDSPFQTSETVGFRCIVPNW